MPGAQRITPAKYLRGFTIIEIMIVISILAILAAIGLVAYNGFHHRTEDSMAQHSVSDATRTLQLYYV